MASPGELAMLPMDKPALAKKIREAFDDNVYPGDDNIFDGIYDPDIDSWKELLLGISWDEALSKLEALVGSDQNYYDSMAFFMTAEALYYYTPMYLLLTIDTNSEVMGDGFMF